MAGAEAPGAKTAEAADKDGRILVTGIPLMPGFRNLSSQRAARLRLHLDPDIPVVLVLGGGLGLGVATVATQLLASVADAQVLVLTGHNTSALTTLDKLTARYPGRVRGWDWTEQIEVFICAADIVVGKPGGLTVAEALACGRPLLATTSLCGQESFNVSFLERHGVGRLLTEDELPTAVTSLLANPDELARIQRRAWTLGRRDGARQIAQQALVLASSPPPAPGLDDHDPRLIAPAPGPDDHGSHPIAPPQRGSPPNAKGPGAAHHSESDAPSRPLVPRLAPLATGRGDAVRRALPIPRPGNGACRRHPTRAWGFHRHAAFQQRALTTDQSGHLPASGVTFCPAHARVHADPG